MVKRKRGPLSAATRKRISDALQGRVPSFFGKTHTAASKAKMRAAKLGRKLSAETRANMSAAHKGKKIPPAVVAKVAAANTGKRHSKATKEKIAASKRGKPLSAAHRQKISDTLTGRTHSPETKAKIAKTQKANWDKIRATLIANFKARGWSTVWQPVRKSAREKTGWMRMVAKIPKKGFTIKMVREVVSDLPVWEHRMIQTVFGFFEEPLSIAEAAKAWHISQKTARKHFAQGLRRLKKGLEDYPRV